MNLKFIQNAFDRLGQDGELLQQISANTQVTAEAVVKGGELFDRIDRMVLALEKIEKNTKSGKGGIQEAIVLKLVAPTLKPIGLGMQFIVDALNSLPDAKEAGEKMDALTKGLVVLGEVGKSILQFAAYMIVATPLLVVTALLAPIWVAGIWVITKGLMWATDGLDKKRLKSIALLGDVGKSLFQLAGYLSLVALLTIPAMIGVLGAALIVMGIAGIFKILETIGLKPKKIDKMGDALKSLALGLLGLSLTLALISLIVKPVLIGLAVSAAVILGVGLVFYLLDILKVNKKMKKTSLALMFAGLAIVVLAASVMLAAAMLPGFESILTVLGVVAGIALVFYVAGMGFSQILKGSLAMLVAGVALIVLGFGVKIMTAAVPDLMTGLGMIALIAGLGVVFALIGAYEAGMMTGIPLTITLGSIAMMLVGVSLLVLSLGVKQIAEAVAPLSLEKVGMIALVIGGIGAGFAAAGFVAPLMMLGAGAFLLAGGALIAVGKGLEIIAKLDFNKMGSIDKKGGGAFNWSGETTAGFLGMFKRKKTNLEVAMEAVADSVSLGPLSIIGVMAGAPTLLLAGAALTAISKGLLKFDEISGKMDLKALGVNVAFMTSVLADAFGEIGTKYPGGKKSLFSSIFGGGKQSAVADGISSTMGMGGALSSIARGMQAMANLKFPTKYDKEGNPIEFETMDSDAPIRVSVNAAMITGVLADVFGRIGTKYPGGKKSLMASIFGGGKQSPVADGISAVMGMGDALTGIAKGFQAMANLNFPVEWDKEGKPIKFETIDIATNLPKVMANTQMIVQGLSGVFAEIGKNPDAQRSWFFGRSTVQKGIDLVASIGTPLYNLASGVQAMANLKFPTGFDKDGKATGYETITSPDQLVAKVGKNTQLLVQALVETFTIIGQDEGANDGGFWWWQASSFEKGVEVVKSIAEPYKNLGEGITKIVEIVGKLDSKAFAGKVQDIISVFTSDAATGTDIDLINNRRWLTESIGETFEKLGKAVPSISTALSSFKGEAGYAFYRTFFGPTDEGARAEGYNAQKWLWMRMGEAMLQTKESMPAISQAINAMDMEKLVESRKMFEALAVLSEGGEPADILAAMGESLEEALQKLANMLSEFKDTVAEGNASTGGALEGVKNAVGGVVSAVTGGKSSTPSGNNADVVRAVQNLQKVLITQGIKVKDDGGGWFG